MRELVGTTLLSYVSSLAAVMATNWVLAASDKMVRRKALEATSVYRQIMEERLAGGGRLAYRNAGFRRGERHWNPGRQGNRGISS